ncbi:MAG: hypothetical protein K2W96_26745 [Gemmataceae bacterium]|nr:hypothetical protein [Gemmataceae bacterium]
MTALLFLLLAADDPVVLAKGKSFIVHALADEKALLDPLPRTPSTAILHTGLPSGKTRTLCRSRTVAKMLPAMAIDRYDLEQTRVVGIAADKERLYVLVWSASWRYEDFAAKGLVVGKPPESDSYMLRVFWLEDGKEIESVALGGKKRPKALPGETAEKGPLEAKDGEVEAYGEVFRYKGRKRG